MGSGFLGASASIRYPRPLRSSAFLATRDDVNGGERVSEARTKSARRRLLLTPTQVSAGLHIFAVNAHDGLIGDQRDTGVGVTARFLAGLRVFDTRGNTD